MSSYTCCGVLGCGKGLENPVNLGICGIFGILNCGNFGKWKLLGASNRGILCFLDFFDLSEGDWLFSENEVGGSTGAGKCCGCCCC